MNIEWRQVSVRIVAASRHRTNGPFDRSLGLYDNNLWVIHGGTGRVFLAGAPQSFMSGDVLWLTPRPRLVAEGQSVDVSIIRFLLLNEQGNVHAVDVVPGSELMRGLNPGFVETITERITALAEGAWNTGSAFRHPARGHAETLLTGLLMELEQHVALSREQQRKDAEIWDPPLVAIQDLARRISEDPTQVPSVAEMATSVGLSVSYFSLLFKRFATVGPQKFVMIWRVRHACRLLLETPLPVKAIAEMLGYRDVYFFSRQFKSVAGKSPSAYRRQSC